MFGIYLDIIETLIHWIRLIDKISLTLGCLIDVAKREKLWNKCLSKQIIFLTKYTKVNSSSNAKKKCWRFNGVHSIKQCQFTLWASDPCILFSWSSAFMISNHYFSFIQKSIFFAKQNLNSHFITIITIVFVQQKSSRELHITI